MKFVVLGRYEANRFESDVPWACVSIGTEKGDWPKINKVKQMDILQIAFADADKDTYLLHGEALFTDEQAHEIWDFIDKVWDKVEVIMFHCLAGQCRSPAVAAAIAKVKLGDDMEYFAQYTPNRYVYSKMLKAYHERTSKGETMEEKFTFFWRGPFSQWQRQNFTVDGVEYNCCEQYMMAQKALLFKDSDTHRKIMDTSSPKEQKALGREVKNFNEGEWNKVACDIVFKGNYAKFSQNKDLKEKLMATKGTTLVEASPVDKIWGIGLAEDDPKALSRSTWQGKNWLGECITKVREALEKEI